MEQSGYITLTRLSGLMREMQVVANNIANASTSGFRQEGVIFSEYVRQPDSGPSLSMSAATVRQTSDLQGALTQTGGQFDLAIEGDGYFLVETPSGERLTRAGSFATNAAGDLVTHDGHRVLDAGGAPIFVPPDVPEISISGDGTLSSDDRLIGQIGLFEPADPTTLTRESGLLFRSDGGVDPIFSGRILQGFLEDSNVNTVLQIARMIEVQRAYELGQSFLETEDTRIRNALNSLTK